MYPRKPLLLIIVLLFGAGLALTRPVARAADESVAGAPAAYDAAQGFVAHEWGTFTTVRGSDGVSLPGLILEEESLPEFVYGHPGIGPEYYAKKVRDSAVLAQSVTVKMETPVIYFYSMEAREVDVRVRFQRGMISQWFPQRRAGEPLKFEQPVDLAQPYEGDIAWQCRVLAPDEPEDLTWPPKAVSHTWQAPRETRANPVAVALPDGREEREKYLFYRGVGNFETPLAARIDRGSPATLRLDNHGGEAIPFVWVFERDEQGRACVWWTGGLAAGEARDVTIRGTAAREFHPVEDRGDTHAPFSHFTEFDACVADFRAALQAAGLYADEATAMLRTWRFSYFSTPGFRVFWVLPRAEVDRILPIDIHPSPNALERVIVGRMEMLTPEFEDGLLEAAATGEFDKGAWLEHRYRLAYQARIEALTNANR